MNRPRVRLRKQETRKYEVNLKKCIEHLQMRESNDDVFPNIHDRVNNTNPHVPLLILQQANHIVSSSVILPLGAAPGVGARAH